MSAFVVGKAHVDLMVKVGLEGPRGRAVRPDTAWYGVRWSAERPESDWTLADWQRAHRTLDATNADEVGDMLVRENVRSVMHCYPDTREGGPIPGPCDDYWREPYRYPFTFRAMGYRMTAVEGLKAVRCYEYQSCECPDWRESEAFRFCEALTSALVSALPGMDEAPWDWSQDELARRGA